MSIFHAFMGLLSGIPAPLATMLIAMVPSVELSVALPVAVLKFGMPVWLAYLCSVFGSFIPALAIFAFGDAVITFLRRHSRLAERFFTWLFARTRGKFMQKYERYGEAALLLLVAFPLPLPLSGAWTASLAGWLVGIPARRALPLVLLGLLFAGGIMVVVTLSGSALLKYFIPPNL